MSTTQMGEWHFGRSFADTRLEDGCPCAKAPCGLVRSRGISDECPEHRFDAAKTIRQSHFAADCPTTTSHGAPERRETDEESKA